MVQFVKLRLSGFKSFVDPTELLIEPGTTGIVGPNGCGKSNIVEALRWVMGETSAKRMRGSEMDDVIFGGSGNRPSRNLAEVTLTLDNQDRRAPAAFNDFNELEVVRRIEREQGSLYRINGKEVRARDVQLLFADSATGAQSTAIVSQGRIGTLINAKPTDRRLLLEEAAGITGLHSRRHEAELRLRAAETNLERLDDVIGTLEAQLAGLRKQARQATRYRNIADQLRRNEAILLLLEKETTERELARAREALGLAERAVTELTAAAAEAAARQAETASALPPLRQGEAAAAAALQRLLLERDSLDREAERAAEMRAQAEARRGQVEGDLARAGVLQSDAREAETRLVEERERLEAAATAEQDREQDLTLRRDTLAQTVGEREEALTGLAAEVATAEARRAALERQVGELTERLGRQSDRLRALAADREKLLAESDAGAALEAAEAALAAGKETAEASRLEAEAAETAEAEARSEESACREALQQESAAKGRIEAEIAALTRLLDRGASDLFPPVVDALTVEPGFEAALGAALGDDLEAPTDEAAPVHWASLPGLVGAPALPPGAAALAAVVRGPAALDRRLSQVGVVENAAAGARLQAELKPGQRLVSREGGLWRWDGFTAMPDAPTASAQRLAQKNRLADLSEMLRDAEARERSARERFAEARAAAAARSVAQKATAAALRAAFAEVDRARETLGRLSAEAAALSSRLAALEENRQRLTGEVAEAEAALASAREELAGAPDLAASRARLEGLRRELAEERAALSEAEGALQRLLREREARGERLAAIFRERQSWERRALEAERHRAELAQRLALLQQELEALAEQPQEIAQRRSALLDQLTEAEAARRAAADALATGETRQTEADRALKTAEQAQATAREERIRAEAAVGQGEQILAALHTRVGERLNCGFEVLAEIAGLAPDQEPPAAAEVTAKIERLERERENIGPVNLRADVEAAELEEQIAGLNTERADLVAAIARLRQGISSLNREGRERLLAAFAQVDAHFSELFVRLFGGGRAHLKLTEAEDPLEAGLEIMASPPGKRLQVLSLLSGGEQALTAIALLFAVFLTNPAPICVLDEVDAPLDDSNVDRFCSLVEELAHSLDTRFLLITHHRLTMARVDRLFGVTMQERGVSQLVSVDLEAAEAIRESA